MQMYYDETIEALAATWTILDFGVDVASVDIVSRELAGGTDIYYSLSAVDGEAVTDATKWGLVEPRQIKEILPKTGRMFRYLYVAGNTASYKVSATRA